MFWLPTENSFFGEAMDCAWNIWTDRRCSKSVTTVAPLVTSDPANSRILGRHAARSTSTRYNPLDSCLRECKCRPTIHTIHTNHRQATGRRSAVAGRVCAVSELRRYERQASEMDVLGRRTGTENVLAREMQSLLYEVQRQDRCVQHDGDRDLHHHQFDHRCGGLRFDFDDDE